MKIVRRKMDEFAKEECEWAIQEHGFFHSDHEGLAILQEEIWEAMQEIEFVKMYEKDAMKNVYTDRPVGACDTITLLRERALMGAMEFVQIAAMCEKFKKSQEARETK